MQLGLGIALGVVAFGVACHRAKEMRLMRAQDVKEWAEERNLMSRLPFSF